MFTCSSIFRNSPRSFNKLLKRRRLSRGRQSQLAFSTSTRCREIRTIWDLPDKDEVDYRDCPNSNLEIATYRSTPRNILLVKKEGSEQVTNALVQLANYIVDVHPSTNIITEPRTASEIHSRVTFPIYTLQHSHLLPVQRKNPYHHKTSLMVTLGGDGTILHASSIFSSARVVPPVLSFSMGTLGFLNPWPWWEHRSAIKQVLDGEARVLRRKRLRMGVWDSEGNPVAGELSGYVSEGSGEPQERTTGMWAMNEVDIHRGRDPHLAIVDVYVDGKLLTEAVSDGIILSTPTGSTAYSLSSFGSIVHPRVSAILLTPVCPRSLSFRPLILPAESNITLRLSEKSRGHEVEVSVDGQRWGGVGKGLEVRISGEIMDPEYGAGGVPCIWRGTGNVEEGWVSGLNGLLKFNYPFGEEVVES